MLAVVIGWACEEAFVVGFGMMAVIALLIWALDLKRNCRPPEV